MLKPMSGSESGPDMERLRGWADRVAAYFAQQGGLPPITGRTLGWLMVSDPPEQSPAEIAEAIQASRASLTSTLRLLQVGGLVQQVTRAGDRTTYYRIADDAWATSLRQRFASLAAFLDIARDGLEMLGPGSARAERVQAAHDVYGWLSDEVEPLWKRWDARR